MKPIQQNLLVVIGCIIVALVILAVFSVYSTKVPLQRQAIHVSNDQSLKLSNPNGLIKLSEIKPNSMTWFWYPDPDRFKDRDPFDLFLLIRLPDYLGGTVNDASALRAYSAIDPSSHCIVKYWPEEGRRRIEDPCGGNMYEPMYGHAIQIGGNPILVSENLGLPYLTVSSDKDGYLYVEPPIWTEDKNGVIGIGRRVSAQEIESANELITTRENQIKDALEKFHVPDKLSTGHSLSLISNDGIRTNHAMYFDPNSDQSTTLSTIMLYYEYCNCTKSKELLADEEGKTQSQLVEIDDIPIVAYPIAVNYLTGIHDKYVFVFYNNGYKISLYTNQKMEPGLNLVKEIIDYENKRS
ncbi:MAG TPA: hypothetical protein VLB45_01360 [Nitrosopumilaceae archaeon]|nr:hypothetical protein [Nitrosopumilaceae archaeon]